MAALTLTDELYRDKLHGAWLGKAIGTTLGAGLRGSLIPGHLNFFNPVPGQPTPSLAIDFSLVWLDALEKSGAEFTSEDLAVAWLEHLDYSQDELGYAMMNLKRGLPPPAAGAHSNPFRHGSIGAMRGDFWGLIAPGSPQTAAAYAYRDTTLDHCEDGEWAAMFLSALTSAAFFLRDPLVLMTIGLAMIPKTCRTARAIKTAFAASQRGAGWLEARESVLNEVGSKNYTDVAQNMGFFTIGLFYGLGEFGSALCAGVNCGYDSEMVGGALGTVYGVMRGASGLPEQWTKPMNGILLPGNGVRDLELPFPIPMESVVYRTFEVGKRIIESEIKHLRLGEDELTPGEAPQTLDAEVPQKTMQEESHEESESGEQEPASPAASDPQTIIPEIVLEDEAPTIGVLPKLPDTAPPIAEENHDSSSPNEASDASQSLLPSIPQPVSEAGNAPVDLPGVPTPTPDPSQKILSGAPLQGDPINAIAWTDSTLVKPLLVTPIHVQTAQEGAFFVTLDTGDTPTISHEEIKRIIFFATNKSAEAFTGRIALRAPAGWQVSPVTDPNQRQFLAGNGGTWRGEYLIRVAEGQGVIHLANALALRFVPETGEPTDLNFVLMGGSCWWTVGPFANFDGEGFDRSYRPEENPGLSETYVSRMGMPVHWEKRTYPEVTPEIEPLFGGGSGVVYGQTIFQSPTSRSARIVANVNSGVKVWLNGALVVRRFQREAFRPQVGSGIWAADIELQTGANVVIVKWIRSSEPIQFSLTFSDREGRGLPEVGNTQWR